jgi:serine/threonine-protein kinase RsbW
MGNTQTPAASPLPLWWSRPFRGEPSQVGKARSWLAGLLPTCDSLDDLLIFTSELAGNAVTHTRSGEPGGWFTVEVTWSPKTARVVVGDQGSDEIPTGGANASDTADLESGRGLLLIEAMSAAWGTAGNADARWLWADVDWRSRGGPLPTAPTDNSAQAQFTAMRCAYPGIRAWYSTQTGQWHATLPSAADAEDTLAAPSPGALVSMITSRKLAASDLPRIKPTYLVQPGR